MTENEAIGYFRMATDEAGHEEFSDLYKEMCSMAIQALEEIQQYRAIETELRERYHANVNIKILMQHFIETIFKGEKHEGFCILTNEDAKMWDEYQAIGTIEECRTAVERMKPKKPIEKLGDCYSIAKDGTKDYEIIQECPNCHSIALRYSYPCRCGQVLDWSE